MIITGDTCALRTTRGDVPVTVVQDMGDNLMVTPTRISEVLVVRRRALRTNHPNMIASRAGQIMAIAAAISATEFDPDGPGVI